MKTLLLLDVDGPLNPYASSNRIRKEDGYFKYKIEGFNVWLNDAHGPMLTKFATENDLELVWATTWEHKANEYIGWRIGLPELPVIEFGFSGHSWKTDAILEYAEGRELIWFDDDFRRFPEEMDEFKTKRISHYTSCHEVSPKTGLLPKDIDLATLNLNRRHPSSPSENSMSS